MSESMLDRGTCRSCGADIVWVYTLGGKKAPFQPDERGEWEIDNGVARRVGPPPTQIELGAPAQPQRYTSHFAACPQADGWRKP